MVNSRNHILRSKSDDGQLLFCSFLTLTVLAQNAIFNQSLQDFAILQSLNLLQNQANAAIFAKTN